ncbi:putative mitochondrial protein [Cucumis melo var. makuwa]|uniref:Mitochondrial protein n=1 Tax=Cucumis melo var. makuwa TaxID=1194695 RepID=A0A5D3DA69_CUCMM|nr:putative mitochondrial protein [Cucumis melo var. makuwa]TYK20453.1 putative mitochondrial protein [Cucumis melo var. makuwa]
MGSELSSLTNDKDNSSFHSNVNRMVVSIEPTSVGHFDASAKDVASNTYSQNHPSSSIIGDVRSGITTRKKERKDYANMVANVCYTSTMKLMTVVAALTDEHWILAMQEELLQFERNESKGFVDLVHRDHVYKLRKALYGLKQALEPVQIYVEDIIFGGTSSAYVKQFVNQMKGEFEMSMVGELTFFIGFQIKQDETGIFFSQEKYAKNLISKFRMDKAKPKQTPAATHLKLTKDATEEQVDSSLYRSIIGSLLNLIASRPDIAFAVGMCARYQADPRTSHLQSAKRILKYIIGTCNFDLWYTFDTTGVLVRYCDADWVGCSDDRKSTYEGCCFLGNNIATWFSKKQNSVSLSTAEAEYIAGRSSCS